MKNKKKKCVIANDRVYANALRYFRKQAGLTQVEAAKESEITQVAISQFEDGETWPRKENVFRLCYTYNISLLDLFDFIHDDLHKLPAWALEISIVEFDKEKDEVDENE